jgi:hypothetical protein
MLLMDQLGSVDPLRSLEQDRFERLRDPSHQRLLPDVTSEVTRQQIELERYLELAGLDEEQRVPIRGLAPGTVYEVELGWYLARKQGPS